MVARYSALCWEEKFVVCGFRNRECGGGDEGEHEGIYGCEAGGVEEGGVGADADGCGGRVVDVAGIVLCAPADGDVVRDKAG